MDETTGQAARDTHESRAARIDAAYARNPPRVVSATERAAIVAELARFHVVGRTDHPDPSVAAWVLRDGDDRPNPWAELIVIEQLDVSLWAVTLYQGRHGDVAVPAPVQTYYTTTLERMAIVAKTLGTGSAFTYRVPLGNWW
ncbi:hypothetical protein [Cellulomonas fimi]|uniref:hypothetical protein n=1 Tax=Cellulomonas fimi TaxID=1708 RepID=UPI0023595995|nr:hypothetical protein [Cellulomonas fimi]